MIGILGYYRRASLGDDLLEYAMRQLFGEVHAFTVSSPHNPTPIPLEQVNSMKALIVGGGTLLGNALPYPLSDTEWVQRVEVPLYVFGAGAKFPHRNGVLEGGRLAPGLAEAHHVLKAKSRFFGVRGPLTRKVLAREGIQSEIVGDPALALVPGGGPGPSPIWLVNFRSPRWFGEADYEDAARDLVEMLAKVTPIEGLAFDRDDADFLRSLGMDVVVPDLEGLSMAVQACAGVVAMRLHACVLAAVCGKPFVNLGYELKSWDFQQTVTGIDPVDFVPRPLGAHDIMRRWHLINAWKIHFLEPVQESVECWRDLLVKKANRILEDMG